MVRSDLTMSWNKKLYNSRGDEAEIPRWDLQAVVDYCFIYLTETIRQNGSKHTFYFDGSYQVWSDRESYSVWMGPNALYRALYCRTRHKYCTINNCWKVVQCGRCIHLAVLPGTEWQRVTHMLLTICFMLFPCACFSIDGSNFSLLRIGRTFVYGMTGGRLWPQAVDDDGHIRISYTSSLATL